MKSTESISFTVFSLVMLFLLLLLQGGCTPHSTTASRLYRLQGYWEGEGPPGRISITIMGNALHFHAGTDSWHETTFTLPAGTDPQQLHATITNSSPPNDDVGRVVFAIFKIEDGTLTLAVNDGSDEPPTSFADASSRYTLKKAQAQEKTVTPLDPGAAPPRAPAEYEYVEPREL